MPGFRPSYWETTALLGRAELLVVGAGLTGLHAAIAYRERRPDADVLVLERGGLPRGASTRNAGFACFGSPTELLADLDTQGEAQMLATVAARWRGIRALRDAFPPARIDWREHGGYELFDDPQSWAATTDRLGKLNRLLAPVTGRAETWSVVDKYRLHNPLEAQLHPGRLVAALLDRARTAGVRFLFGCGVREIGAGGSDVAVETEDYGTLRAERVLVATNAFAARLLPAAYAAAVRPVRNQVLLSRPLPHLPLRGCYHYHAGYVYFRNVGDDRLLIGGGRHRAGTTAETDAFGDHPEIERYLIDKLADWFPDLGLGPADFVHRWSGILAQGNAKSPLLEFTADRVLVAARLAGMGVALSASLGRRAAERLT